MKFHKPHRWIFNHRTGFLGTGFLANFVSQKVPRIHNTTPECYHS
jgi:hypothetical protein